MKITFKELYSIAEGQLEYDKQEKRVFDLTLLLVKNSKLAKAEIETFEEAKDKLIKEESFVKYQQERQELIDTYKLLDEKGEPVEVTQEGQQGFQLDPSRMKELTGKLIEFDKPHTKMLDAIKANNEAALKKLNEEVELPLMKIISAKYVEALDLNAFILLAPIIDIKLTKKMLGKKSDKITAAQLDRILDFCDMA